MAERSLYLISQSENLDYDTFDSVVVCAESSEEARRMHPELEWRTDGIFDQMENDKLWVEPHGTWCSNPTLVSVRRLGAAHRVKKGIVLASFNAG